MTNKKIESSKAVAFEKFVESDSNLRIRFVPLEPGEHTIDIRENGKSIEGFPVKVNIFNSREPYVITEGLYGVTLGSLAKLSVVFNEPVDSLNVKVTSKHKNSQPFLNPFHHLM